VPSIPHPARSVAKAEARPSRDAVAEHSQVASFAYHSGGDPLRATIPAQRVRSQLPQPVACRIYDLLDRYPMHYVRRASMAPVDPWLIDLPRVQSLTAQAVCPPAAARWHLGAEAGSAHWPSRATTLFVDPLADVMTFEEWVAAGDRACARTARTTIAITSPVRPWSAMCATA
jgi:hypothetical protein